MRTGRTPNPKHCCCSSDVLTPPERATTYQQKQTTRTASVEIKIRPMQWGDIPRIRKMLDQIRGK